MRPSKSPLQGLVPASQALGPEWHAAARQGLSPSLNTENSDKRDQGHKTEQESWNKNHHTVKFRFCFFSFSPVLILNIKILY